MTKMINEDAYRDIIEKIQDDGSINADEFFYLWEDATGQEVFDVKAGMKVLKAFKEASSLNVLFDEQTNTVQLDY